MTLDGFSPAAVLIEALLKPHTVYALYWRLDVVYVGCTSDIMRRLPEHMAKRRREANYRWDRAEVRGFMKLSEALRCERKLIAELRPIHNRLVIEDVTGDLMFDLARRMAKSQG